MSDAAWTIICSTVVLLFGQVLAYLRARDAHLASLDNSSKLDRIGEDVNGKTQALRDEIAALKKTIAAARK